MRESLIPFAIWALGNVEMPEALREDIVKWLIFPDFKFPTFNSKYGCVEDYVEAFNVQNPLYWCSWGSGYSTASAVRTTNRFFATYQTYTPIQIT